MEKYFTPSTNARILSSCLLVCLLDCVKTVGQIASKPGRSVADDPRMCPLSVAYFRLRASSSAFASLSALPSKNMISAAAFETHTVVSDRIASLTDFKITSQIFLL